MKIAVLPGDGIGTEIVAEAVKVLNALDLKFEMETAPVGGAGLRGRRPPAARATLKLAKKPTPSCSAPWATGSTTPWSAPCAPSKPSWACARPWACSPTSARRSATSSWHTPPA